MHLPKFLLPGCQRGFGFLPLLLAVVEDGWHVLPEVGRRQDGDSNDGGEGRRQDGGDGGGAESDHANDDKDLEQAFAEFGSWFFQKNSSRLPKVVTLESYSTCGTNRSLTFQASQMAPWKNTWGKLILERCCTCIISVWSPIDLKVERTIITFKILSFYHPCHCS